MSVLFISLESIFRLSSSLSSSVSVSVSDDESVSSSSSCVGFGFSELCRFKNLLWNFGGVDISFLVESDPVELREKARNQKFSSFFF